jgi:hypothetical protein
VQNESLDMIQFGGFVRSQIVEKLFFPLSQEGRKVFFFTRPSMQHIEFLLQRSVNLSEVSAAKLKPFVIKTFSSNLHRA